MSHLALKDPLWLLALLALPWAGVSFVNELERTLLEGQEKALLAAARAVATALHDRPRLLDAAPHLSGVLALHHGSLSDTIRKWVEDNLHSGNLKAVICTSSLDLGVDFRSVDTVIITGIVLWTTGSWPVNRRSTAPCSRGGSRMR